jgi:hypothetical protein
MANKCDTLIASEEKGKEYAKRGTIHRSPFPDENRWLWYYEPDDEKWNAFQYGHGMEFHRLRVEEAKAANTHTPSSQ